MHADTEIDISFDFRSDTPPRKDPDALSQTLRRYHQRLWSKPLPNGAVFALDRTTKNAYLHHRSDLGEFFLSSDSVIPTFSRHVRLAHIIAQIPLEEREAFLRIGYTIGGMMVFPANKIAGQMTINGARGFAAPIGDRFDLSVECIRRHYHNECSPLTATLQRYAEFFALFGDFQGYATFFLLQDLVSEDVSAVNLFTPWKDFGTSPVPVDLDAYRSYRELATEFIEARNRRIRASCSAMQPST